MISIEVRGDLEVAARLESLPEWLRAGLARTIAFLGTELQQKVRENLSGRVLKSRSGRLRDSIDLKILEGFDEVAAEVGTGVPYGRFHEFGVGHLWLIRARQAKALRFQLGNRTVFARSVTHPGLPERSFLRSALREMEPEVRRQVEEAVVEAMR